jgi:hypothetical protein
MLRPEIGIFNPYKTAFTELLQRAGAPRPQVARCLGGIHAGGTPNAAYFLLFKARRATS